MNNKKYKVIAVLALSLSTCAMSQPFSNRALTSAALGLNTALPAEQLATVRAAARKYPDKLTAFFDTAAKAHILGLLASTDYTRTHELLSSIFTQWQSIDTWPVVGASHPLNERPDARAMRPMICQFHLLREQLKKTPKMNDC